jgi:hypothetical protein
MTMKMTSNYLYLILLSTLLGVSGQSMADNSSAFKDAIGVSKNAPIVVAEVGQAESMPMASEIEGEFKKLDANKDQKINAKEAAKDKEVATQFTLADANKDGALSLDEFTFLKSGLLSKTQEN